MEGGLSDSASVNCLLGLDDEVVAAGNSNLASGSGDGAAAQSGNGKNSKQGQDVHSVPDSPMLETNSSFGSTSSSPSVANLPPIKVHVDDGGSTGGGGVRGQDQKVVGIEEQFAQLGVGGVGQKQDEGFVVLSSPPVVAVNVSAAAVGVPIGSAPVVTGEYPNRVVSDDERSDRGVPAGYRQPPPTFHPQTQTPTQTQSQPQAQAVPPQFQQKSTGVVDLPSPDSVSSDSSLSNPMSRLKPVNVIYQDQVQIQSGASQVPITSVDPNLNVSDPHGPIHLQQHVPDSGYVLQYQFDQQQQQQAQQPQQFMHSTHFIHHTPAGPVPVPAYYPVYPSQQQLHPQHHHQLDQQYPVYYVPARQAQAYNLPVQQAIAESATTIPSSRPQNPPNPAAMVPPSAAYNPMTNAPLPKSEMTAGAYRTAVAGTPQLVQVPTSQHQQQYVAYSQIHHPSQAMAPNSAAPANYAYDYADPARAQIFYTQHLAPTMPSQYHTMAAAAVMQPEVSAQLPAESMKQQVRTSQPL